ncbi:MAG TPA: M23 family metallopeptidase, partial [Gammaproteobacteria bacterium]|nr:M23 family metallopeptidase [Gammaproteobacteria bacterium]
PPRVSIVSRLHFINQGGSEMVVYRATPPDVESGVRVGNDEYPGYPAKGAGIDTADPAMRVAFFALLWNQAPNTPISVYARDQHGNQTTTVFDYRVFPKEFHHGTIRLDDGYLKHVVPPVLANSPEFKVDDPSNLLASYVRINRDMRKQNRHTILELAKQTAPEILWRGAFEQLPNSAVEANFADQRTYYYKGQVVDHEVHLGYDLASVAGAPVTAANSGRVLHAGWLGIFGNCVIIDHGMGVQSLYGHMSSVDVKVGQTVDKGQRIGREGSTGLAGGAHVHFTMLVNGHAVSPIDWWSQQWIDDRIMRKLHEAGAPAGK